MVAYLRYRLPPLNQVDPHVLSITQQHGFSDGTALRGLGWCVRGTGTIRFAGRFDYSLIG